MNKQMTIFDAMAEMEPKPTVVIPKVEGERKYTIPDDVWRNRCQYCGHKQAEENAEIPISVIHKYAYQHLVPCRILSIARPNEMPGECLSFSPYNLYGICETCQHNNCFIEGFCMKKDHAPERRVMYGGDYGGDEKKRDYWGRHRFSTCDDYEPNRDGLTMMGKDSE